MAERLKQTSIEEAGVNPFNAPIPGESMTNSPDNPKAWERPPQYANEDDAMEALYLVLTDQEKLTEIIKIINDGTALDEIAQVVLYKGYTEGKFNTDLMLMLIEPTLYLLIAIADYAEIKDYTLYEGEEDNDPETQIPDDNSVPVDMDGDGVVDDVEKQAAINEEEKINSDSLSSSLLSRIETELPGKVKEATKENGEV
tara:strand:- start:583 stop:1179 length:597 start_codon:yes stop_codon:yes gene_type:complete